MSTPLIELAPVGIDMADFEAMFKESIPCGDCQEPARWRSFGHMENDCGGGINQPPPPYYKCDDCYIAWLMAVKRRIELNGSVGCLTCPRKFRIPESFSNYRRF